MKVIDLLNKIANGEDVPKKIKIGNITATFNEKIKQYETGDSEEYYTDLLVISLVKLNDEVEIIEDTPKEDKKIAKLIGDWQNIFDEKVQQDFTKVILHKINEIIDKINEIIDKINGEDHE